MVISTPADLRGSIWRADWPNNAALALAEGSERATRRTGLFDPDHTRSVVRDAIRLGDAIHASLDRDDVVARYDAHHDDFNLIIASSLAPASSRPAATTGPPQNAG